MGVFSKTFGIGGGQGALLNQPPAILNDGNTVAWYDVNRLDTITKDVNNFVSRWSDKLGSGHDLIQATSASKPALTSMGILFDGINDFMITTPFAYIQPESVYMIFRQVTWIQAATILSGYTSAQTNVYQNYISPGIRATAGNPSDQNLSLPLNTWGILRVVFNGVSSKIQIGENPALTGDFGVGNMGGFQLASLYGGGSNWSNIEVSQIILRKIVDTPNNDTLIYNYLKKKMNLEHTI